MRRLSERRPISGCGAKSGCPEVDNGGVVSDEPTDIVNPVRRRWLQVVTYGILPGMALLLTAGIGYMRWCQSSPNHSATATAESVQSATESVIAMLSYDPESVEQDLNGATSRLTGDFKNSYAALIHDVVIPGAKQQRVASAASVPAAASVSATPSHAVVLVFVNQTITFDGTQPTDTASSVKVTMEKGDDRWLISGFEPI